jgi:hypothetical protein
VTDGPTLLAVSEIHAGQGCGNRHRQRLAVVLALVVGQQHHAVLADCDDAWAGQRGGKQGAGLRGRRTRCRRGLQRQWSAWAAAAQKARTMATSLKSVDA